MRLTEREIDAIKHAFSEVFQSGNVYLFGSRVHDKKKGGDIDLYLEIDDDVEPEKLSDLKVRFKLILYSLIGEQKIDVIISKDRERSIEKEILRNGVLL